MNTVTANNKLKIRKILINTIFSVDQIASRAEYLIDMNFESVI